MYIATATPRFDRVVPQSCRVMQGRSYTRASLAITTLRSLLIVPSLRSDIEDVDLYYHRFSRD
jgi:hypothetical protein